MRKPIVQCIAVCLTLSVAVAQGRDARPRPVHGPVQDGGTLYLATGVWTPAESGTHPGEAELPGAFDASQAAHFVPVQAQLEVDASEALRIDGPGNGWNASLPGGGVESFQFAYTTREVRGRFGYVVTFYDRAAPGASEDSRPIVARIPLLDLPGAPRPGVRAHWRVRVNLRHTAFAAALSHPARTSECRFSWDTTLRCTNTTHGPGGPILSGAMDHDTAESAFGDGSRGSAASAPGASANGISFDSFHLDPYADSTQALTGDTSLGVNYCDGHSAPVLFHDGFESEDFDAGGWEVSGDPRIHSYSWTGGNAPFEGTEVAELTRGDRITRPVSTVGFGVVRVSYVAYVYGMEIGNHLYSEWWDGSQWKLIDRRHATPWRRFEFDLPNGALDNPDFKIRFRNSGPPPLGGYVYIDDISVEGRGVGHIEAFGSASVSDNNVTLVASGVPVDSFGMFFYGSQTLHTPLGFGFRCVGGSGQQRLLPLLQADESGGVSRSLDFTSEPVVSSFIATAPVTANFQYWHRDHGSSNLTDALQIQLIE